MGSKEVDECLAAKEDVVALEKVCSMIEYSHIRKVYVLHIGSSAAWGGCAP